MDVDAVIVCKGSQLRHKLRLRPVEVSVIAPEAGGHQVINQIDLGTVAPVGVPEHPQDVGRIMVGAGPDVVQKEAPPPPVVDQPLDKGVGDAISRPLIRSVVLDMYWGPAAWRDAQYLNFQAGSSPE